MRVDFNKVERRVSVSFKCAGCGKRRARSTTIWNTVNPFNKAPNGLPKTQEQVRDDVDRQVDEWKACTKLCARCES